MAKITNTSAEPVVLEFSKVITLAPGDEYTFPNGYDIKIK